MRKDFKVEIIDIAQDEITDAYEWYEDQKEGLGELFLKSLEKTIVSIKKSPNGFVSVNYHRQAPLKHFPFVVLYEVVGKKLYIDAVFHTNRDPKDKLR